MWQCAKQEGDYEAVAKQSRSSKKATRRERERRAAAWLFHRVTANSLAACQDEAPREREERRKLDRLVFGGWREQDRIWRPTVDGLHAAVVYGNVGLLALCSEIQQSTNTRELLYGVCFLLSRNSRPPSHSSAGFLLRLKTGWRPPLFSSLLSLRYIVSIVYKLYNIGRHWCESLYSSILSFLSASQQLIRTGFIAHCVFVFFETGLFSSVSIEKYVYPKICR